MAKKEGRCKVCRTWVPKAVGKTVIASHRVPTEDGKSTELCRGRLTEPVEKRGNW
jgi:hypothetical protein